MFTDIEGSTRLLELLGSRYDQTLNVHHAVIRRVLEARGGEEVETAGDSFFAVFSDPVAAVRASVDAQCALGQEPWPDEVKVQVRMGLHMGEVRVTPSHEYRGLDVHRAARISAACNGGQVLISDSVRRAIKDKDMPAGISARDMGLHYLKDLRYPEHLYSLVGGGLPLVEAPIRSSRQNPTNLPPADPPPIGRDDDIGALRNLFGDGAARLVTLTGPGGVGKTTLALEVARGLVDTFPAGVFLVPLAPIADPAMVGIAIAQALGVREFPGIQLERNLTAALTQGATLLVLDNMEHIIEAARDVGKLLSDCSQLKVLATSREPLNLRLERVYSVNPLSKPPLDPSIDVTRALRYPAVRLFVQRAATVRSGFELTPQNLRPILSISERLDGLPLAIELAASRMRLLTPENIDNRLGRSFDLLSGGRRDEAGRHRTLRNAIAWSYDLLEEPEQRAFAGFSVFRGGFSVESSMSVCADHNRDGDTLDLIVSLLNRNLLRESQVNGETRLSMLESVRDFASARLDESPGAEELRRRHAEHYRDMAVALAGDLVRQGQRAAVTQLFDEIGNMRAALSWAVAQPTADLTSDLLRGLVWFWVPQGLFSEGRSWIEAAIAQVAAHREGRTKAIIHDVAGWVRIFSGDYAAALESCRTAHALFAAHGTALEQGRAKANYGITLAASGQIPEGPELIMTSLKAAKANADPEGMVMALVALGECARYGREFAVADEYYKEAMNTLDTLDNTWWPGGVTQNLAHSQLRQGHWREAVVLLQRTYQIAGENDYRILILLYLMAMGGVGVVRGRHADASRLLGATRSLLQRAGAAFEPPDEAEFQRYETATIDALGDAAAALSAEGAKWSQEEAVAAARRLGAES